MDLSWMLGHTANNIKGEKSSDRTHIYGRFVFFTGLFVSAYDSAVIRNGSYPNTAIAFLGAILFLAGIILYFAARLTLGKFFSEKVRIVPEHKLITKGPYRIVRHPIYLGEILYFLSIPMIFSSLFGFFIMLALIPLLLHRIIIEENVMSSKFGQEFQEYARRTKKLIPYIY